MLYISTHKLGNSTSVIYSYMIVGCIIMHIEKQGKELLMVNMAYMSIKIESPVDILAEPLWWNLLSLIVAWEISYQLLLRCEFLTI